MIHQNHPFNPTCDTSHLSSHLHVCNSWSHISSPMQHLQVQWSGHVSIPGKSHMEEIRPKKNWSYFYAILCHAMPYAPSGYLVVFLNYCLSPPRENLPWRLKSNFEDHIFSHGIGSAKRPNQTLEVWDSSVGSRRVVASAYRCRVRPCCPKGPTNKCAPKQERSSKTWSFSF